MSDLAMKILKWQSTGDIGISSATLASINPHDAVSDDALHLERQEKEYQIFIRHQ